MNVFQIAWRNLTQRGFSSLLTGASIALGVTMMVAILLAGESVKQTYQAGPALNHNLLIGPKGSSTQLVMNTVYHIDRPIEHVLKWDVMKKFLAEHERADKQAGEFSPFVERAIPICKGDYYEGFQVIATTADYFTTPSNLAAQGKNLFPFADGQCFSDSSFFTAVIGAEVARELKLKVGDTFQPAHGVTETDHEGCVHDHFKVTGILAPLGTPNDRGVFINIEGFYLQEGHVKDPAAVKHLAKAHVHVHKEGEVCNHEHHDPLPEEFRQVSAILLQTYAQPGLPPEAVSMSIAKTINDGNEAQAVATNRVTYELSDRFVKPLMLVLLALSVLVLIASGVSILVSIYNSMRDRIHDIAIMRSLGASSETVMLLMFLETILLVLLGGLIGWLAGHLLLAVIGNWLTPITGITFNPWYFSIYEAIFIPGLILLAGIVGFIPALTAYRTDVAKALMKN